MKQFFEEFEKLLASKLTPSEALFYAAYLHLVLIKIPPFQDGNGKTARLLEKWLLLQQLGKESVSIELGKNYYIHRTIYYDNIGV